jgi:hypothetical protein
MKNCQCSLYYDLGYSKIISTFHIYPFNFLSYLFLDMVLASNVKYTPTPLNGISCMEVKL